ncbi:hypothetical protein BVX98_02025, partial [bacterium F11]
MHFQKGIRFTPILLAIGFVLLGHFIYFHAKFVNQWEPKPLVLSVFHHVAGFYNVLSAFPPQKISELDTFDININNNLLEEMFSDLPRSGDKYKRAMFRWDKNEIPVRLKLRGDNAYHWAGDQKSWRVKFLDGAHYKGNNRWNFINPRSLSGVEFLLGDRLAERFGILSARSGYG